MEKKTGLALSLGIMLVICIGIFIFFRINMPETHTFEGAEEYRESKNFGKREESIYVYEEVEDITERSEVCYDNLIFLYSIFYNDIDIDEEKYTYLAIFNTGDVYCFKSSANFLLDEYISANQRVVFDDSNWTNVQNVIYMGQLSNRETILLNQSVKNFDNNWDYILYDMSLPFRECDYTDRYRDITCLVRIYYPSEEFEGHFTSILARYGIDYLGNNSYENGFTELRTSDNGTLAALDMIESGGFYKEWMNICVENYEKIDPIYNYDNWIINPIE